MTLRGPFGICAIAAVTLLVSRPCVMEAQMAAPMISVPDSARDGAHDFDFMHGEWKATLKRLVKPLTGSTTWVEFAGTQTTKPIWDGSANMDEFIVDNTQQNIHIRGMTLRLYNPATREWSIYWANKTSGTLGLPAVVGRFKNGRGEFYDQEEFNGRTIFVRYAWSDITPTSAHFEQSFSTDAGKTWETNWISDLTRPRK
ncbi:MAG: hypothetical protein ABJE10_12815 [bacterium]